MGQYYYEVIAHLTFPYIGVFLDPKELIDYILQTFDDTSKIYISVRKRNTIYILNGAPAEYAIDDLPACPTKMSFDKFVARYDT